MRNHLHRVRGRSCGYLLLCSLALCTVTVDLGSAQTLEEGALSTPVATDREPAPEAPLAAESWSTPVETNTVQPTEAESTPDSAAPEKDAYPIEPGDRLKILVYDRSDLTAEYRVSDQGSIRIPTLGSFDAKNRSPGQVEQAIAAALERLVHRPGIVTIDVVERRPIFVTGLVAKPGAYRFSAGMAVIQATALAGGTASNANASGLPTEALREGSRAQASEEELKHLLAIQARLNAERTESSEIVTPPALVQLAGAERAADLIRDERENMIRAREIFERRKALLTSSIEEANTEIAAFKKEFAKIQEQRTIRETSVDSLEALSKKGLTTQQRLTDSQFLLASADRDAQTAIANIARSQQNLDKAEHDLAVLALVQKVTAAKELQNINDRIVRTRMSIEGAKKVVGHITGLPSEMLVQGREPQFRYEIIRKGSDGELHTTPATEMSKLQPGDVVRISAQAQTG